MTTTQRRRAPDREQNEADKRDAEISRRLDRTGPDRIVKRGAEQTDDGGVDAAHYGLRAGAFSEGVPERQRAEQDQDTGKKNAEQTQRRAGERRAATG